MPSKVVTFGEIMLRLAPPGFERFLQSPQFVATFGGGEANVAVTVAGFGLEASYVTVLPENPIADAIVAELRRFNVSTSHIQRAKGRVGVYYVEAGANQRASKVVYDRDFSSIASRSPAISIGTPPSKTPPGSTSPASRPPSAPPAPTSPSKASAKPNASASPSPATSTTAKISGSTASSPPKSCASSCPM